MIVTDVNLIVYRFLEGPHTEAATEAWNRDSDWIAPTVWLYEFVNVMATHVRRGDFDVAVSLGIIDEAKRSVRSIDNEEFWAETIRLAADSKHATFDCEFIVLARRTGVRVVTADKKLRGKFPEVSVSIEDFASGR